MLKIIRRVFDFGDWSRSHATEPHPGDMLDAQFDEIIHQIDHWDARVKQIITEDGTIADGVVTETAIDRQLWEKMQQSLAVYALELAEQARKHASRAEALLNQIEKIRVDAQAAGAIAKQAADEISTQRNAASDDIRYLLSQAEQLRRSHDAATAVYTETANDVAGASAKAEAWAEASWLWAEHMPDTLPDNAVKIMDISGDHWSSRWWANRADNAFGRLTDLYLGAWPDPPLTNLEGGPIETGSIYYDTDDGQPYVWDGNSWQPFWAPNRAVTSTLWYLATEGQTTFPLTTADQNGNSYAIDQDHPEGLNVFLNGIRLVPGYDASTEVDYVVDVPTSTVTMARPLRLGDLVAVDFLLSPDKLAPGAVTVWSVAFSPALDGTTLSFTLTPKASGPLVNVTRPEELLVSLDGVIQEPGTSYTAIADQITFSQPPSSDSKLFIVWYQSAGGGAAGTTDADTPTLSFDYAYNNNTAAPPGGGQMRMDQTDQTATDFLYFSGFDAPGVAQYNLFRLIKPTSRILVQDKDNADRWQIYHCTGALEMNDAAKWVKIPVAWEEGGATPVPTGQRVLCVFAPPLEQTVMTPLGGRP